MRCPHCGETIPMEALFCNYCGNKVQQGSTANLPASFPPTEFAPGTETKLAEESPYSSTPFVSTPIPPTTTQYPVTPLPSTQFAPLYAQTVYASPTYTQPLPQQIPPAPPPAPNRVQRFMLRTFQLPLASNAVFGVILGGLLAIILGVLITQLMLILFSAIAVHTAIENGIATSDLLREELGFLPTHAPFRDALEWFLAIHGVSLHIQYNYGTSGYTYSFASPLHSFLVIPAFLLLCGGYLAACTDLYNRPPTTLLRGAAVALPYTALMLLMLSQVNGDIPDALSTYHANTATLTLDIGSTLLYGLLWGSLFGTLGASLKLAQGQWRHMVNLYLISNRQSQISGMITGGLIATGAGITLSLLPVLSLIAYTPLSVPLVQRIECSGSDWQALTSWALSTAPLYAVNLFAFLSGAPITVLNPSRDGSCFYTNAPHTTFWLFDAQLHLQLWFFALLLIPLISLFLGGRASVAIARVRGTGPAAVQGALIAIPFMLLMIALTLIATVTISIANTGNASSGSTTSYTLTAGVRFIDMLLWGLLSGAIIGSLGGMYQASTFKTSVSHTLRLIARPVLWLCTPIYILFDLLCGYPRQKRRSAARNLLYGALLCTILLAIGVGIAGTTLITKNQTITIEVSQRVQSIFSILCIAIPGLFLLTSAISALAVNPATQEVETPQLVTSPLIQ